MSKKTRSVLGSSTTTGSGPDGRSDHEAQVMPGSLGGNRPRKRIRIRGRVVFAGIALAVVMIPLLLFVMGWWRFSRIETVDVSGALSPRAGRSGTNYLIVGLDSRAGISVEDDNSSAFLGTQVSGARTDTIMVLHLEGSSTQLASIPRDLWVTDPATGQKGRINSTFATGPSNLIRAVESIGIPVDDYLQIDFVSFEDLVDAVGGITIDFAHPTRDEKSGLYIDVAGPNHLNGSQALAYVRSRTFTELIDGRWRVDGTADIGRTERQRAFLSSLVGEVSSARNPLTLLSITGALDVGMTRSSTFSYFDALGLAWTLKDTSPQPVALPVTPRRTTGGADVLELKPEASQVISELAR